jgi:ParB family chromosome partitioning protein
VRSLSDQNRLELSLIENVQRTDLNAIEVATAFAKLKTQFNLSLEQIAERVGKSGAAIANTMRLLSLPEEAKKLMMQHGLSEGQMRPLVKVDAETVMEVMPRIVRENWSARKVEQYVTALKARGVVSGQRAQVSQVYDEEVREFAKRLGAKRAEILLSSRGTGKIVLRFDSEAELRRILGLKD